MLKSIKMLKVGYEDKKYNVNIYLEHIYIYLLSRTYNMISQEIGYSLFYITIRQPCGCKPLRHFNLFEDHTRGI